MILYKTLFNKLVNTLTKVMKCSTKMNKPLSKLDFLVESSLVARNHSKHKDIHLGSCYCCYSSSQLIPNFQSVHHILRNYISLMHGRLCGVF